MRNHLRVERLWRGQLRWYERLLWLPAVPAAGLYALALKLRSLYWNRMRRRADMMIVSVGNLTVGGSGKTPFTLFLAHKLSERAHSVGIVSRGYRGRFAGSRAALVSEAGTVLLTPEQAGDEAVMMARRFDGPVAVARRRIDAVLLLKVIAGVDTIVLDDGFQHIRLARDFDLLLVNEDRGFGNGWILPAGPMREPIAAARRADAVVLIGASGNAPGAPALRAKLDHPHVFRASIRPRCLVQTEGGRWREMPIAIAERRVLAISGLADANAFYEMIREQDADLVGVLEYSDHHAYTSSDWQDISNAARSADITITTEKDLVKLERFPFPRESLYALRVEVSMDERDSARLLDMIVGAHKPRRTALA